MIYILRLLFGYVIFEFSGGFSEDFLNDCYKSGIDIKNVTLTERGIKASCSIRTYKGLHKTAFANGGKVKILKKAGLPFLLAPLKNRTGFFVGITAFIFILCFLEGFIWNVEIVSNDNKPDSSIAAYLESNQIKPGVMWSAIDRDKIKWSIMSDFDDIAWVHINKIGTTARVEINKKNKEPDKKDENNLKGNEIYRKEITAIAYKKQNKIILTDKKDYDSIIFFTLKIPLYFKKEAGDTQEISKKFLTVNDVTLPIGIINETEKFYKSIEYEISDKEAAALAKKKLAYEKDEQLDGYEIINENIKTSIDNDKCTIKSALIVRR